MKIKTLFRTLLAVMVAVIMSMALVVFAACGPGTEDPTPTPSPEGPAGPGGPGGPGGSDSGLTTGNSTYDAIIGSQFAAFNLTATEVDSDGEDSFTTSVSVKANLDGKADVALGWGEEGYSYYFLRDWAVYALDAEEEVDDFSEATLYGVLDVNKTIGNLIEYILGNSDQELLEDNDLSAGILDAIDLSQIVGLLGNGALSAVNYTVLSLADAANAVVVDEEESTVTVDLNKMAYNMVNDLKPLVTGLTEETTVGEILGNQNLKKYLQIVTNLVTPQQLVEIVAAVIENVGGNAGAPAVLAEETPGSSEEDAGYMAYAGMALMILDEVFNAVEPDENSTTYDYLVKVISSQELVDAINTAMGLPAGVGIAQKISEFTIADIFDLLSDFISAPITLESIQEYVNIYTSNITETELKVVVPVEADEADEAAEGEEDEEAEGLEIFCAKNMVLVYGYDENGVTSMGLTFNMTMFGEYGMDIEAEVEFSRTAYEDTAFATLPEELPEVDGFEFGGDNNKPGPVNPGTEIMTIGDGENVVSIPAGGKIQLKVNVPPDVYKKVHIYTDTENVYLMSKSGMGTELTLDNVSIEEYKNDELLTIAVYNTDKDVDAHIFVEEDEDGGDENQVKDLHIGEDYVMNYTVDAGAYGKNDFFKVTIQEEGDYVIVITATESGDIPDMQVFSDPKAENEVYAEDTASYDERAVRLFSFEAGEYYITIWNSDVTFEPVSGTGMIGIVSAADFGGGDEGVVDLTIGNAQGFTANDDVVYSLEITEAGDYQIVFNFDGEYTVEDLDIVVGTGYNAETNQITGVIPPEYINFNSAIPLEGITYYISISAEEDIGGTVTVSLADNGGEEEEPTGPKSATYTAIDVIEEGGAVYFVVTGTCENYSLNSLKAAHGLYLQWADGWDDSKDVYADAEDVVVTLLDGNYTIKWNINSVPAGIYMAHLKPAFLGDQYGDLNHESALDPVVTCGDFTYNYVNKNFGDWSRYCLTIVDTNAPEYNVYALSDVTLEGYGLEERDSKAVLVITGSVNNYVANTDKVFNMIYFATVNNGAFAGNPVSGYATTVRSQDIIDATTFVEGESGTATFTIVWDLTQMGDSTCSWLHLGAPEHDLPSDKITDSKTTVTVGGVKYELVPATDDGGQLVPANSPQLQVSAVA